MFIQRYIDIQTEKASRIKADGNYTGIFDKNSKVGTVCQKKTGLS